jgi:hypothetical protein
MSNLTYSYCVTSCRGPRERTDMAELPGFTSEGLLPIGDYELTFSALRQSMLVAGPGAAYPGWDASWRAVLVDHLEVMVKQLWQVGIDEIFIDGSFVEDKDHPNDIDGYFVCPRERLISGELERDLNLLDPYKVWTWNPKQKRPYRGYPKKQLPMWHQYRVELYPHYHGQFVGIFDSNGNELMFPSAFRQSKRDFLTKGIVQLIKG